MKKNPPLSSARKRTFRLHPVAHAIALTLLTQSAHAALPGWMQGGAPVATQPGNAALSGNRPGLGLPGTGLNRPPRPQVDQVLRQSLDNMSTTLSAIAAAQARQAAQRDLAFSNPSLVPNGLVDGGLKIDTSRPFEQAWQNAEAPTQTIKDGHVTVDIKQTADKAVLNWETFNVGRDTTVAFDQQADWAVLNRVNDPNARPSQIQGQIKADGTVMLINRNGVVFSGSSQVNVRNLVVAAADMSDSQFTDHGLYGANASTASFTQAGGQVIVEAGALIETAKPASVTQGGGYVLLLGSAVHQDGRIVTPRGQAQLAAGDSFIIRRGVGTDGNTASTTRGNEVAPQWIAGSSAGLVRNTGLLVASEGDITLAGRDVRQEGVAVATTTVNTRGTVHLLNAASDSLGQVTLGQDAVTAVLIEDDGKTTALDSQREALIAQSAEQDLLRGASNSGAFDNYARLSDRRDQSRIEIVSGGDVVFEGGSLTLATGGQLAVQATGRSFVSRDAALDVSGAVNVSVSMGSNTVRVNVQGNELRDSAANRDSGKLANTSIWVDRRELILVPAGTGGYETDRWYTAGGLLEVSGYLSNQGRSIGEWAAQGGTLTLSGQEVITQAGSRINLAGGTLDVGTGYVNQTWIKGSDGKVYAAGEAPAHLQYAGLFTGAERVSERWGVRETFYNPLVAPGRRLENGYVVGRDAGSLIISAPTAVLEGEIDTRVYNGERQIRDRDALGDGYGQAQTAWAQRGRLLIGRYELASRGVFDTDVRIADIPGVTAELAATDTVSPAREGTVWLDAAWLAAQALGVVEIGTQGAISIERDLTLADGGQVSLLAPEIKVAASIVAHGGQFTATHLLKPNDTLPLQVLVKNGGSGFTLTDTGAIDLTGRWLNGLTDTGAQSGFDFMDGGSVTIEFGGDVALAEGSLIDVSSGGAVQPSGAMTGGRGGNVTLIAGSEQVGGNAGHLQLDGRLAAAGVHGGGRLALTTGGQIVIGAGAPVEDALNLSAAHFQAGFSAYDINGQAGVQVAEGATIDVLMPVYRFGADSLTTPTGAGRTTALEQWTPPLYQDDTAAGHLVQRAGADLTLRSQRLLQGGDVVIGEGATVSVDPGATIRLASPTQMTVEGRLNAWGGAILLDAIADVLHAPEAHDRSIWIGDNAVLDVAGRAVTAVDGQGQRQGWVQAGGTIQLGSALDWESGNPVQRRAPDMHVVIRPGALLDASGSSAVLDLPGLEQGSPRAPVTVASDGGSIVMGSANALYIDGTLRAAAGGEGASGGTLALTYQGGTYNRNQATEAVLQPRVLVLTQHKGEDRLGAGAQPGDALEYGTSYLSVEQIDAGGFDHLSLFAPLRTPDDLTLSMGQSLRLWSPFGVFGDAAPERTLHLSAPYLMLGVTGYAASGNTEAATSNALPLSPERNDVLRIDADHLDVFGRNEFTGFADVAISSQGDIRLLATAPTIGAGRTTLFAPDRMTLTAAQIYAASGADGYLGVGDTNGGVQVTSAPDDHLFIRSHGGPVPDMPHSVGGTLHLAGGLIEQGGVLRAPLGFIEIGRPYDNPVVRFLSGSLTSVSGAGLVMPYGGTVDGITYHLNGVTINAPTIGGTSSGEQRQLLISGEQIIVEEGAVLDLSGGGDLRGAGFVSGRGGSVDILATALANANPAFGFSLAGNPVYALVPGYQSGYAPTGGSQGQGAPATGQQVTVPDGVPGLPAGTYTLMPSSYALLPGAFRVEIGQTVLSGLSGVSATGSGSFVAAGYLGTTHTGLRSPVASQLIITPADVVRLHSGYNETSYNEFILADAARRNVARDMLTVDARALRLNFSHGAGLNDEPALTFDGTALFAPAADSAGFGGILGVSVEGAGSSTLQILADGQSPLENLAGAAIEASQLNAFNANRVVLGGYLAGSSYYSMADNVILRSGATLRAPEVALTAGGSGIGVLVEQGATIDTTGLGKPGYASDDGYLFDTLSSALVVSNSWINLLPSTGTVNPTIDLGGCAAGGVCTGETRILTEGTLAAATNGAFTLRDSVSYGARDLVLAVSAVNLGSAEALAEAGAAGQLPPGMALNQQLLAELLDGNTAQGTPALQTLVLNARDAFNIYGSVTLDTFDLEGASRLERLVFGAPAIYGYGSASDVTAIRTGEFIWAGTGAANPNAANRPGDAVPVPPGAAILDRLAGGTLDIHAETIRFGYVPNTQPVRLVPSDRIALGFDTLNLNASKLIAVDTDNGSLHVYRTQTGYTADQGWHYAGGELNINTPLLSGGNGGKLAMHAGGAITVTGSGAGAAAHDTLGAELRFVGQSIHLDTAVVLPSGKLVLDAVEDVVLGAGAKIDLAGREVTLFDVKRYSWGGDLVMTSRDGNIRTAAGSVIDISARHNRGGSIDVTALGEGAGQVDLLGTIHGSASGIFDAGGTLVPYDAGQFTVRAQSLTDFAALNARLNDGEVFGARRFQIRQGDLVVGNEVKAREVQIIVDGGDLTVNGKIDASGQQVGAIRLAAKGDLVINGTLDAHATGMRLDSYGKPIAAANRAAVELATREGTLVMGAGAVVDLRTGTASAFADNIARGTLDLIAPRVGTDDVAVDVRGAVEVRGAKTVAVYGLRRYDDAPLASLPDVSGTRPQLITQSYLDGIDLDSQAFMEAALGNASLAARLAGLAQYRLRPAVEITSNAALNPDGHLTVAGDIDLSAYRYGPDANRLDPARRGFGEPGMLVLRAAGDLNIHGSINDGFAPPPDTPDDNGWLLTEGRESYYFNGYTPFGGDIVVPIDGVVLDTGTIFPAGAVLNYDITVAPVTLPAGATVPVEVSLTGALSLPAGLVLSADVTTADGTVLPAGTVLADTLVLGAGAKLAAGFLLRDAVGVASFTLPKGTRLATALTTDAPMTLARGALIPSMTKVELVNDEPVNLRPVDGEGRQGRNWALAPMLPEGTTSWDLTLVAGADTGSSDMRARNVLGAGDIVLADTHYGQVGTVTVRYEGGSGGGGGLVLTADGAMAAFGDARYAGLNAEELEAQLLADYGFGFEDFWGMSLEGYCDFDPGSCAMQEPSDGMEWAFNEEGAIGFFGEASLAGKTQQEIDAWMQDNWGMSWDYAFNGESMASVCKGNDGFCTSTFIDPTLNMEGALGWIGEARFAGLTAEALDAALMDAYSVTFQDFFGQTLPDFCNANPTLCQPAGFAPPTEVRDYQFAFGTPAFSVLRTGTGDLSLVAGRDVAMMSLYGVYTAGQQTSIAGIDNHRFNLPRGGEGGSSLGAMQGYPDYDVAQAAWQAWYPDQGGNLLVSAGRNILGDSLGALATSGVPDATRTAQVSSVGVGNWLWRQGTGDSTDIDPVDTSWWINFGSYVQPTGSDKSLRMTGFTGFGALGGGNVRIQAAGDAGIVSGRGEGMRFTTQRAERSQGLVVAVGSTGRMVGEQMTLTGGGDLDIRIGGRLNPNALASQQASSSSLGGTTRDNLDLNGVFTNLRGTLTVTGGGIGGMTTGYGDGAGVRPGNPFAMGSAYTVAGPVLMLGDATAWLETRGDLVLAGAGNPGLVDTLGGPAYTRSGELLEGRGVASFSLWTPATAVNLFSAGGDLAPAAFGEGNVLGSNLFATRVEGNSGWDYHYAPAILRAVAPGGNILINPRTITFGARQNSVLLMAPSPSGALELLAGGSVLAQPESYAISMSGASMEVLSTPFNPAFSLVGWQHADLIYSNQSNDGINGLIAFGPNTVSTALRSSNPDPVRIYAVDGDITGLRFGAINTLFNGRGPGGGNRTRDSYWYEMASAVQLRAGTDILDVDIKAMNNHATDVTLLQAGRDIVYAEVTVAGPGNLDISAGRQIRQDDVASVQSIGSLVQGDTRPGASIALLAGQAQGVEWSAVRDRYLDTGNLANSELPLAEQPGKAVKVYDKELSAWLKARFGIDSEGADALSYFDALAPEQQRIFLREVYYAELREGGREYNDADGPRFGSYLRGREMIATLLPDTDAAGNGITREGDIVMFGGAGVRSNFGGPIEMMAPGGQILVGVEGVLPPASAGVMTQGEGDIRLFSEQSLLLGLSRIMTTFGGDIFAWSAEGDINAGRGAKTTVLFTPPRRTYDQWGNVRLAPQVPSSGAGIATLNPIPEVPPGDIDLIAPLGTIDAGEAGIRVSGNVNVAALQVLNADNIQVQGEAQGIPVVAAVNTSALNAASSASSAAAQAAEGVTRRQQGRQPSMITVEILGFGDEPIERGAPGASLRSSAVDVLGQGPLSAEQLARLTDAERRRLAEL